MKKVILKKDELKTIAIDEITNSSIVGVYWSNESKAVVLPCGEDVRRYVYKGFSLGGLDSERNRFSKASKKDYAENAINTGLGSQVFVFDTVQELGKWLAE